jgi:hypothetical protein
MYGLVGSFVTFKDSRIASILTVNTPGEQLRHHEQHHRRRIRRSAPSAEIALSSCIVLQATPMIVINGAEISSRAAAFRVINPKIGSISRSDQSLTLRFRGPYVYSCLSVEKSKSAQIDRIAVSAKDKAVSTPRATVCFISGHDRWFSSCGSRSNKRPESPGRRRIADS